MKTDIRADSASSNLDGSKRVGSGSSGSAWLGRAATIQRQKCPGRYAGMNAQGFPVWTDSYADAKEIPAAEVLSELNRVGMHEPMSWAVLFPQNAAVTNAAKNPPTT